MRFARIVLVLLFLLSMSTGCAFTKMETARQLGAGEAVYSGGLDWPGIGVVPRASAGLTYGIAGGGDVSAHLGTTVLTANGGLGARAYISPRWTAGLRLDAMGILTNFGISEVNTRDALLVTATPRLTTAVQDGEWFYGGLQAQGFGGFNREESRTGTFLGSVLGVIAGVDYDFRGSPFGLQSEVIVFPLGINGQGQWAWIGEQQEVPATFQFSIGLNYRRPSR